MVGSRDDLGYILVLGEAGLLTFGCQVEGRRKIQM